VIDQTKTAYIKLWEHLVGAVAWDAENKFATFEYDPDFLKLGLDVAPLRMPIEAARSGSATFSFRTLPKDTYYGLPGMLADALPDRFGSDLINRWLAAQGRSPESFNPVERLCYTGKRAMGALEFEPVLHQALEKSVPVEIAELVKLVQKAVDDRANLKVALSDDPTEALLNILRVGTSAGGNRPKAIIAWDESTDEIRSGQVEAPPGFGYWVLKFDGVKDRSLGDPAGFGRIEYAYYLMAKDAGINMNESRLLEEEGRAHFMTRRFDRNSQGGKLHSQTLCAIAHFDFNSAGAYSYEQAFQVNRELRLPYQDMEQFFRRMIFNVIARNQDDHTKNISYLMDKKGIWRLSPAYDIIYAYNPDGRWTHNHQMTINGKRTDFSGEDLIHVGKEMGIRNERLIIEEIVDAVSGWQKYSNEAGVERDQVLEIRNKFRAI